MISLSPCPTKFCGGTGLLWRGITVKILNHFLRSFFTSSPTTTSSNGTSQFLFESSRSALFHSLSAMDIGFGSEVIVCAFTCDAVTYAVVQTGATVVYVDINDDLSMCSSAVFSSITDMTKALIVQNTFGRLGLDIATIEHIKSLGIFVIEDCALSIGSRVDGVPHGSFGHVSTWSLEVSKTLTIGWGGVLSVNDSSLLDIISQYYCRLRAVPLFYDLRRFLQLWISVFFMSHTPPFGIYLWYLLHGLRIFRRSRDSQRPFYLQYSKLGLLSSSLFYYINSFSAAAFRRTNINYITLATKANLLGLSYPIIPKSNEYVVSPRFSLIIYDVDRDLLTESAASFNIELGSWFDESPPVYGINLSRCSSSANVKRISSHIVNLPCHWSLSQEEIRSIMNWMERVSLIRSSPV